MKNEVLIPAALQICIDDVGWWCGRDDRTIGGPSRTGVDRAGVTRHHCVEDYLALHEFGEAIGQKLYCAFVLGEWDMEDRLGKEIPHFSHFGDRWQNSVHRSAEGLKKAVEIVNASPYIDVAVHGLYHGYYMDGIVNHDVSDYYYNRNKDDLTMVPEEEVRLRLDHFFRLYREHGFTKSINGFVPPTGAYRGYELSSILRDYGILYNICSFGCLQRFTRIPDTSVLDDVFVDNDLIVVKQQSAIAAHWWAFDSDFTESKPSFGVVGLHWPNVLHQEPSRHRETLVKMVPYFKRCADIFGIVISKGIENCATQELCRKYAKIHETDNAVVIDLSNVPNATGRLDYFAVSVRQQPASFENCTVKSMEQRDGFINYELIPCSDVITVRF